MGLVGAVLFAVLAAENRVKPSLSHKADSPRLFSGIAPAVLFVVMAIGFSCRDFAGSANATLSSLYLQRAHGDSMKSAGQALSIIFVASVISSPLFGILSDRHRLRWGMILLILSALCLAALGQLSRALFPWGLAAFGFFLMATYPVIEAAIMEAVPNEIRSRFFGLFITIAGLLGNLSHWYVGRRVDALGEAAWKPQSYSSLYLGLGLLMLVTPFSLIVVRKLPEFWKLRSPAPEFIPTR